MLDCVLISQDDAFRRQVTELVGRAESNARLVVDLTVSADQVSRESVARIVGAAPKLAFVDLGEGTTGLRVVGALSEEAPDLTVVVTGPALAAEALLEVMRQGATEYLPRPLTDDDVAGAFRRLRKRLGTTSPRADAQGLVRTVFSCKGGTGVTTVAVNLAVLIASRTKEPTLLLDLNPGFGTAELHLGLQPRYSYLDVIHNFHRMDTELLESFTEDHRSGVTLMAAPPVEGQPPPTAQEIMELVRLSRRHFAHVVIDAGSHIGPNTLTVLEQSDEILMVAAPDIPTLRNLKRAQSHLHLRELARDAEFHIVMNQSWDGAGVTEREVREVLGDPVFARVDRDDDAVQRSLNTGTPLGESGRSRFARSLGRLGDNLLGTNGRSSSGKLSFLMPFRSSSSDK